MPKIYLWCKYERKVVNTRIYRKDENRVIISYINLYIDKIIWNNSNWNTLHSCPSNGSQKCN